VVLSKNNRQIIAFLGITLAILGISMFLPLLMGLYDGERRALAFGGIGLLGLLAGGAFHRRFRETVEMTPRSAYHLVILVWLMACLYGALPYLFFDGAPNFSRAFFESASGFTTTGATIFNDVESQSRCLLLWRSMTHWLGGMGIVVLFVALMGFFGNSGLQMFKVETNGPLKEKVAPSVRDTAKILLRVYICLTAIQIGGLLLAGMPLFDAVCHAFGVVATGGFSTRDDGIAAYGTGVQALVSFYMLFSGVNFSVYYLLLKNRSLATLRENDELMCYFGLILTAALICGAALWRQGQPPLASLRAGFFQVTSIITSTGYIAADYPSWPPVGQFILFFLPFIGACAGSTGGGIKVSRFMILCKGIKANFTRLLHPRAVIHLRANGRQLEQSVVSNVQTFFSLYVLTFAAASLVFSLYGFDLVTAISLTASCVNNVGSGFGIIGPAMNYGQLPAWILYFLSLLMLMGRLELYAILIVFSRDFWRES
jgi:trk system potassium uptake protein TrkH